MIQCDLCVCVFELITLRSVCVTMKTKIELDNYMLCPCGSAINAYYAEVCSIKHLSEGKLGIELWCPECDDTNTFEVTSITLEVGDVV